MKKLDPKNFSWFSTFLLAKEAQSRGIKVENIIKAKDIKMGMWGYLFLEYKGHQEIVQGQRTRLTTSSAANMTKNKVAARELFKRAGISVTPGKVFSVDAKKEAASYAQKLGYPVVVKGVYGTHGTKVFVGVKSKKKVYDVMKHLKKENSKTALVERQFIGTEYRFFSTDKKFLAAMLRVPANVVGDGKKTIKKLIQKKNSDPRRGDGHEKALVKIAIDDTTKENLKEQKLTLSSVPEEGKQIFLRKQSNLSQGGDSIDMTDNVHEGYKELSVKAIQAIPGLGYAGIDIMSKDITKPPTSKSYIIIELNDSPMLSMHHFPYIGKERNIAGEIIDLLFPETKKKRARRFFLL